MLAGVKYLCENFYAGMNTGIQDAHNLAWKIASVLQDNAPSSLLNTYDTERKPVLVFLSYLYQILSIPT